MEYTILGLLMLKQMTAYEISNFIRKNLVLICSGSAGSVQTALKKLLKNKHITVKEFIEGGINKRIYTISENGKVEFERWIESPMQANKVKNMELSKMFFLGFANKETRIKLINDYIFQLREVQGTLKAIKDIVSRMEFTEITENIMTYQKATLEYGIDSAEFEIQWYTKLLESMEN